jgi:hypothetical protein
MPAVTFVQAVLTCIKLLPDFELKHRGSYEFLNLIHEYNSIFFDDSLFWEERIERAGYVTYFLRYWRAVVTSSASQTLKTNFITNETLLDVEMSLGALLNTIGCWLDHKLSPNCLNPVEMVSNSAMQ